MSGVGQAVFMNQRSSGLIPEIVVAQMGAFFDSSSFIAHPEPGYVGRLDIYMIGLPSLTPFVFDGSAGDGLNGTGEMAEFRYTCIGDETSFTLQQQNTNNNAGVLNLIVNGGINNAKFVRVGSGPGNPTAYGHGGAAAQLSTQSNLGATRIRFGASRPGNSTLFYSDDTDYDPAQSASYGAAGLTYKINADPSALRLNYSSVGARGVSGRIRFSANSSYTNFGQLTGSLTISGGRVTSNDGASVCVLVFRPN